jgi:transposase
MKKCPRCGHQKFWLLSTGQRRCQRCGLTRKLTHNLWQSTRIAPYWKGRLVEYFCLGVPAYRLRFQVPLDQKTIERWFRILREAIYVHHIEELSTLSGEIEMDEAMFVGYRPRKYSWGASGKHIVFGIYQRNGKVLTFPITCRSIQDLAPLMTAYTKSGGLYYTDDWHAYTFLDIRGNCVVIRKDKGRPKGRDHIDSIEGFWSYAKRWLYHYRGVPKQYFHLYLKETEWRFNHRNENLILLLRKYLRQPIIKEPN